MAAIDKSHVDIKQGGRRSSVSAAPSAAATTPTDNDDSVLYSDATDGGGRGSSDEDAEEGAQRCSSESSGTEIVGVCDKRGGSSVSELSVEVDLESGIVETKVHLGKVKKDCRICHLSFDASNPDSGIPIELGCSCKDDLAAAHKQCAEAWFKIRGNKTCEICGSTARNVVGANDNELLDQWNVANDATVTSAAPTHATETRNFWQGHRFLNFLLACMVFAFVISWLFHFNVPS